MPEALRPYWTPESRVYRDNGRYEDGITAFRVYPSQKVHWSDQECALDSGETENDCLRHRDTLLPNRTVTTESILGTASAAKAVEQGVADAVEGRTVEVSMPMTKHDALYDAARRYVESSRYEPDSKIQQDLAEAIRQLTPLRADRAKIPDPLDQLAAEAQAEGEYGTAWDMPRLPNPECSRCKDTPSCGDGSWRWVGKWWEHRCRDVDPQAGHWAVITPTPRRTAREVAREAADKLYAYNGQGWEFAAQVIQAAIERDREGR